MDKLEIENPALAQITAKERKEENRVDKIALREAVINATVHNDYSNEVPPRFEVFSDRIEITSSGGLVQAMTEEEFFSGYSAPRNKELMRVFKDVRLVEQLGSGMMRILRKYDRSIFTIMPNFIKVSFPFLKINRNGGLNGGLKSLLDIIKDNPGVRIKAASELLENRSINTIEKQMRELVDRGLIERRGSKKSGGYYAVE